MYINHVLIGETSPNAVSVHYIALVHFQVKVSEYAYIIHISILQLLKRQ